jgi:hypothetical protein
MRRQADSIFVYPGRRKPRHKVAGLPATQLTRTLRTLHRRNLLSQHEPLVVGYPASAKQWKYRPMLGRSRYASELQTLIQAVAISSRERHGRSNTESG